MCKRVSTVAAKELVESFTTSATCTRSVQKASGHYLMAVCRFRGTFLLPAAIQPLPGFRLKSTLDDSKHSPPNQARLRSKFQPGSVLSTRYFHPATHGLTSSAFYIFPQCLTHGDSSVWYAEFLRSSQASPWYGLSPTANLRLSFCGELFLASCRMGFSALDLAE